MPFTEIQTRKVISAYGGVGSIIETPQGALVIDNFDGWLFFKAIQEDALEIKEHVIKDNRLLNRLKHEKGFPNLSNFLRVPSNVANPNNQSIPFYPSRFIGAHFFPEWFYCNKCDSFHSIKDWWQGWKLTLRKYHEPNDKIRDLFWNKPKCHYCYENARQKRGNDGKRRKYYYELEQVRFILTSPKGELDDIPWDRWNSAFHTNEDNESRLLINLDSEDKCCDNQSLKYIKSTKFSDLSGIRILCRNCNKSNTLFAASDKDRIAYLSYDYSEKAFIKFNGTDLTFTSAGVRPSGKQFNMSIY